jgi:hypothetical protein
MGNLIVFSNQEKQEDTELDLLFNIPIGFIDPNHPDISVEMQKAILRDRYHDKLITDGIETGNFQLNQNGTINFQTKLPQYTFAGFIFEALAVRIFNDNMRTIGRNAFGWCTNRSKTKNDYIDQFKAIGTGFISTKQEHPDFYNFQHRFDIQFIRKNQKTELYDPATVLGTTRDAGVQVKAITGNEKTEIIEPLISGKYSHVLTFLRHADGLHSHTVCMQILNAMYRNHEIDLSQKNELEDSIRSPEMLGEDQRNVDDYYNYINHWYQGRAEPDNIIYEGVGLEIKGFKYSSGILVPDN